MKKYVLLSLIIGLIAVSCTDPNTIGLEIQPSSDNIIISSASFDGFNSKTESEDSLRTDEPLSLILGQIIDDPLLINSGGFYTQILLTENNTNLGTNPVVDSVVLSYTYSGYYGALEEFNLLDVNVISEDLYKDSMYYSNSYALTSSNNVDAFNLSNNTDEPFLRIRLNTSFGQDILDLGEDYLKDNETFLQIFKGISVSAQATNTMLYLNADGSNSYFKIYYHNDDGGSDTLSLDFTLGGDAARLNLFSIKDDNSITEDNSRIYIQSMAGYKVNINLGNLNLLRDTLNDKAINKATIIFDVENGSQSEYEAHEKLVLVRVNQDGDNIFLSDFTIEGELYFGGMLENDQYEFNITRYIYQLLNNESYTNNLYLLPAGAVVNANRTILNKDMQLKIYFSDL